MKRFLSIIWLLTLAYLAYAQPAPPSNAFVREVDTLAQALSAPFQPNINTAVLVKGRISANDGGGGLFNFVSDDGSATNLGTVFRSASRPTFLLKRIYSGPIDVRWFGATGDGVSNDYASIQNAVTNSYGKSLFIPDGSYLISGPLRIDQPVSISGSGNGSVLKPLLPIGITSSNVTMANLSFHSTSTTTIYTTNQPLSGIRFSSVKFDWDAPYEGCIAIDSSYTEGMSIDNCTFLKGGIQTSRANNITITGNYFDMQWSNTNEPIHISQFSRGIIADNTILNTLKDAMDLYSSGDLCIIANNRIVGVGKATTGITAESGITLKIELTDTVNTSGPTLGWEQSTIVANNIIKDYNPTIEGSRWYGISMRYGDTRSIPAWNLTNANRSIIISENIIDGFWTDGNPMGFTSAFFAGVHFDGYGALIEGNIFRNIRTQSSAANASETCGIELGFSFPAIGIKAVNSIISKNIYNGEGTGIKIYNAEGCVFEGNQVGPDYANFQGSTQLNPRYGVVFVGPAASCRFTGNVFDLTFANPLAFTYSGATITDCVFTENIIKSSVGSLFPVTTGTLFSDNQFGRVRVGESGTLGVGNTFIGNRFKPSSASEPAALNLVWQVGAKVIGNSFNTGITPLLITGDSVLTNIVSIGSIHGNTSTNFSGGKFVVFTNVSELSQNTFSIVGNGYNALDPLSGRQTFAVGASTVDAEIFRFNRTEDTNRFNSLYSKSDGSGNASIAVKIHDGSTASSQTEAMRWYGTGVTTGDRMILGGNTPDDASILQLNSTTQAFLPPRMTQAQRVAIASPESGHVVYQTDGSSGLYVYSGGSWRLLGLGSVTSVGLTMPTGFSVSGSPVTGSGTLAVTTALNGILRGTGSAFSTVTVGSGLSFDGTTLSASGGSGTVTSVGMTVPTGLSVSGSPVTGSGTLAMTTALNGIVKGDGSGFGVIAVGSGLSYDGTTLSATGGGGATATNAYSLVSEEGTPITMRTNLNFIGSTFTAADNPGSDRTDVTADSDVNALASTSTTGLYTRTGSGTSTTRTITAGSGISVSNGDGVSGNPTVALSSYESGVFTTKTLTANIENIIATIPMTDGEKASFILQWSYDTDGQLGTAAGVSTISVLHSGGIVSGFSTQATHSEVGDAIWVSPPSYNDGSPVEITFTPDTVAATTVTFRYKIINLSSETITIIP